MSNRKRLSKIHKRKKKLAKKEAKRKRLEERLFEDKYGISWGRFQKSLKEKWSPQKIEPMSTEEIITKLHDLGVPFNEQVFRNEAPNFHSPEKLADHLWKAEMDQIPGKDADFPWMSAEVLWQRFLPDLINEPMIVAGIDDGDLLLRELGAREGCDRWLALWTKLHDRLDREVTNINVVEEMYGGYYSVSNWLREVADQLAIAGEDDPTYYQKRVAFCDEIVARFPHSPANFLLWMDWGKAEAHFQLGDAKGGEDVFREMIEKYPEERSQVFRWWGICWTGPYGVTVAPDFERAKELSQESLASASTNEALQLAEDQLKELQELRA